MNLVADTSAFISILLHEDEAPFFAQKLATSKPFISAATMLELFRVAKGRAGQAGLGELKFILENIQLEIEAFSTTQLHWAQHASLNFNKLNMGDCFSYALAKDKGLPLLFKGDDFQQTDLELICP